MCKVRVPVLCLRYEDGSLISLDEATRQEDAKHNARLSVERFSTSITPLSDDVFARSRENSANDEIDELAAIADTSIEEEMLVFCDAILIASSFSVAARSKLTILLSRPGGFDTLCEFRFC